MASGFEPGPSGQESSALTTGLPIALSPSPNTCVISRNAGITGLYYALTSAESVISVITYRHFLENAYFDSGSSEISKIIKISD